MPTMIKANVHSFLNTLIPAYQPIIGADHFEVIGFELLGRHKDTNHEIQSLGPFFSNPSISTSRKQLMDEEIRNLGIDAFYQSKLWKQNKQLFININPDYVTESVHHRLLRKLTQFGNRGADLSSVVLEITEQSSSLHHQAFMDQIRDYRNLGAQIALDDVGKGFSSLDRIAHIEPDLLKIDLKLVQKSTHSKSYQHVLHALSILAQRMGSDLLFEGIETMDELEAA
ncbi:EAL domain-containing protein [Salisediminibacterium selenitireducens]|uniref:EAL domain-containing protein n=1 Tax=Salisediminibacterium selenitireducens TaxID=85683 RepID=UPI00015F92C8|nr:EAL domain-containing protein [Salisediminibacterium selenitireducens]